MSETDSKLRKQILSSLESKPGQKGSELADALGVDRRAVNRCLSYELVGKVRQGADYRWRLVNQVTVSAPVMPVGHATEIGRLSKYYLECISQDMEEGASVFAANRYGDPDYAALSSLPMTTPGSDWFNEPGVGRLLGKVRQDSSKLVAWLGYPVRLRRHRTPRWEGFFVEPVFLWHVDVGAQNGGVPNVVEDAPLINAKFLRSMAMGDGMQLAEEMARLTEELGLNVPNSELPELDELVERLALIRPDWDWKEALDPTQCHFEDSLSEISEEGIYNRAIVLPAERTPFTQGLEIELKSLGGVTENQLSQTALGSWLAGGVEFGFSTPDSEPLLEVIPMNTEQRAAVRAALAAPHTIVTGPPGTGKSQVVTNLLINAAWRGMKVLFASKNNKAVDVVEARVNGLGNRPVLLRLGAKEYQSKLATYLTQLLAGNPGAEERQSYEEGLQRHRDLAARLSDLDRVQQLTLNARNAVDRMDQEVDEARAIFPNGFDGIEADVVQRILDKVGDLQDAVEAANKSQQPWLTRVTWKWQVTSRLKAIADFIAEIGVAADALGVRLVQSPTEKDLVQCLQSTHELKRRYSTAKKVVAYKQAITELKRNPSFEEIASRRAKLAEQVAQNSQKLWQDWVQLAPTRLTAAQRKDVADYAAVLQLMTGSDADRVHSSVKQKAKVLQSKVTELFACWAVTSLSVRGRVPFEPGYFDLVVIDEASQCDIASALPMLYRAKRSVIIGDPQQLRHISSLSRPRDSELQHKHGLVDTRIGWMYSVSSLYDVGAGFVAPENIINLRDHHRSHSDIIEFSNRHFYEGRLRVATRYQQLNRPSNSQPGIVWKDVQGDVFRPNAGGALNRIEATAVIDALKDLLITRKYEGTVGVVTPFRGQAQVLQEMVNACEELTPFRERSELLIDTVHRFQGDERDVIFFSPVVSSGTPIGALGFLRGNGNLFNVAITRARGLLHVVGDISAAASCGVDYLESFAGYVAALTGALHQSPQTQTADTGPEYPRVAKPSQVSEWEHILYRALYAAGIRSIPQFSVEQYDLDFAIIVGNRRLNVEVDGERYHRSWTGELCLRDQLRNQRLIELGWDVKRFWVYEVRDHLSTCVDEIRKWTSMGADKK